MKKSTHKRLTAWLLTLALVVTLLPGMGMTALAAEDGGEGNGPPAVEVVAPEDESSGSDETVGTPPQPEPEPPALPESKEEDKTTEDEGDPSGSDYNVKDDTQPRGSMRMPVMPTATGSYPTASEVCVYGNKYFATGHHYFRNGETICSNDSTNYNAYYNPNTGTLTLNGYKGGSITAGGTDADITVVLKGTNTINGNLDNSRGGDITITSDSGGTLSITNTTNTYTDALVGIKAGYGGSFSTGNVTIEGDAKVTITMTHNGTQTYDKAYGIFARENITISGDASVDITCATPNNTEVDGTLCNGLRAVKDVIIDTTGKVKIDVTRAGGSNTQSYGIFPSGKATLTNVGEMEIKWKKHDSNSSFSGAAILKGSGFDTNPHAVNVDTTNCYASYRKGTPRTVTINNGKLDGPGVVPYAKNNGNFLAGDKVNIKPNEKKSSDGTLIPFKEWTSSDVTFDQLATSPSNSFTVPGKNVTVTAKHSPFVGTPTFTPTGDLNDRGLLTFKTLVNPVANEYFKLLKVGEDSSYIGINPATTSTSPPYMYSCEATLNPSGMQVPPGDYYVAEYLNGAYYLSEKFTVNYVKPRPEISVSYWFDPTDFGSVNVGYTYTTGRNLTIDNKGTADTGPLTITVEGAKPEAFTVSPSKISNIAASESATSTVWPAKGLPAGIYTATLKISGDNVNTLRRNVKFTVKDPNASATVSGTALSWNDKDNAEYYLYPTTMEDAAIKAEWKSGSYTGTACTSKGTPTASGKQFEQTFTFDTVAAGDYKLAIFKPDKYVPKIVSITVGTTDYTCGQLKLWLYGDVNYDGAVKTIDITMARQYFKGNLTLTDEQIAVMDMNGDGAIKVIDITILRQYFKGNISEIPIT